VIRKGVFALLACGAALAAPGLAFGQETGGTAAPGATAQPAAVTPVIDPDKVTCKSEAVLGSRFPKKICLTNLQWQQQEQDAKRMLERLQGAKLPPSG